MNKLTITVFMSIGTIIGSMVPTWVAGASLLGGWSVLGGVIGGIIGIWVGAKINKLFF
jgi:hypothetical protein